MTIYSTTSQMGIDINTVFQLNTAQASEYPAPPFVTGEFAWGTDGSTWQYVFNTGTLVAGSAVYFDTAVGSNSVAALTNTQKGLLGQLVGVVGGPGGTMVVPAISGSITGNYFWVQRSGICPGLLSSTTIAANVALHTSGTAGALGITGGVGTSATVNGVVFGTAVATAGQVKPAVLNWPTIGAAD